MITQDKLNEFRSEAARFGFHGLTLAPLMHHVKSAIKKSYIDERKRLAGKIKRYSSLEGSFSRYVDRFKKRSAAAAIDAVDILCTGIIVLVVASLVYLWEGLMLIPITDDYMVPFGLMIAGSSIGGIYTFIQKKLKQEVDEAVINMIVGCVIMVTFIFTLHSADKIHIWKSAAVAGLVGIIVYVTNIALLPACKGSLKTLVYAMSASMTFILTTGLIYVKQGLNRSITRLRIIRSEITQQINKVESALIIEFMLARHASGEAPNDKDKEKELYYA